MTHYSYSLKLLKYYHQGSRVEEFDESSYAKLLREPSAKTGKELAEVVKMAEHALDPFRCGVTLKQFKPEAMPALYVAGVDGFLDSAVTAVDFPALWMALIRKTFWEDTGAGCISIPRIL